VAFIQSSPNSLPSAVISDLAGGPAYKDDHRLQDGSALRSAELKTAISRNRGAYSVRWDSSSICLRNPS
jgi:hypothetical protein